MLFFLKGEKFKFVKKKKGKNPPTNLDRLKFNIFHYRFFSIV